MVSNNACIFFNRTRVFKGSISLDNCTVVESDSNGKPYGFEVHSRRYGRPDILILAAEDDVSKVKWVEAIREVSSGKEVEVRTCEAGVNTSMITNTSSMIENTYVVTDSVPDDEDDDETPTVTNTSTLNQDYLKYGGSFNSSDAKNTPDFQYLQFDTVPQFGSEHKSAMAKHLTPELFNRLKDVKSDKGYTLSNVIMTGVVTPHLGVGATAGDEQCFELFKDLFNPIIRDWHGYDPETQTHPVDLDFSKLQFTPEQKSIFNEYVVSTRVRAARNISGYSLPAGATQQDRASVESVLQQAFSGLSGELAGKYYELGGLTDEQTNFLLSKGFLFQVPSARNLLTGAGAARSWPENRGIFHNDSQTALCWVNEEDHCRIISMEDGGDIPSVFARFCNLSNAMEASAQANGTKLMRSEKLGFLGTCPSNLGTGLRASVMIRLPHFNKLLETGEGEDKTLLDDVCSCFDLQPRGSAGEHSAAVGGKFDVSNKQRLGFSEVQLVQKMIDGVTKLIELEQMLAAGSTPADVRAKMESMRGGK